MAVDAAVREGFAEMDRNFFRGRGRRREEEIAESDPPEIHQDDLRRHSGDPDRCLEDKTGGGGWRTWQPGSRRGSQAGHVKMLFSVTL